VLVAGATRIDALRLVHRTRSTARQSTNMPALREAKDMSCGARYQSAADLEPLAAARRTHQTPHVAAYQSHNAVLYVGRNLASDELAGRLGLDAPTAG
jgi:hypothetical protein